MQYRRLGRSGLLTGKDKAGIPEGSCGALERMGVLVAGLTDTAKNVAITRLDAIAAITLPLAE